MYHRKDYYAKEMALAPLSEEGGYFKETFRSPQTVSTPDREGGERNLFTTIYYMISPELGGKNYLHRNKSDNVHYFHDGWPAKYILVSPKGHVEEHVLGRNTSKGHIPQLRVPGGFLKAGKILEEEECATFPGEMPFTLISEQVSPGFDYRDRHVPNASEVKTMFPELWHKLEEYIAPKWLRNNSSRRLGNMVRSGCNMSSLKKFRVSFLEPRNRY